MKVLLRRLDRGYYKLEDDLGLPLVTLFLDEQWVEENEDPAKLSVEVTVDG